MVLDPSPPPLVKSVNAYVRKKDTYAFRKAPLFFLHVELRKILLSNMRNQTDSAAPAEPDRFYCYVWPGPSHTHINKRIARVSRFVSLPPSISSCLYHSADIFQSRSLSHTQCLYAQRKTLSPTRLFSLPPSHAHWLSPTHTHMRVAPSLSLNIPQY